MQIIDCYRNYDKLHMEAKRSPSDKTQFIDCKCYPKFVVPSFVLKKIIYRCLLYKLKQHANG